MRFTTIFASTWILSSNFVTAANADGDSSTTAPSSPRVQHAARSDDLEEIVVTATRRESSIREIPIAVSAYSGDRLEAAHVESLADLAPSSPNIQMSTLATNANITIRGVGNDLTTAGSDPGVAFHVDGVYLAETGLTPSTFLDVNRVEILRGPQGTLFGRNATGGAVNVIPNTPTQQLSYGVDVDSGFSPTEDHVAGFISGPITSDGTLLGRLAMQQTYNEGFTKNLLPSGPRRLDDTNDYSGRGQLMWLPTEDFNARLSVEYQKEHDHGPGVYNLGVPDPAIPVPAPIFGQPTGDPDQRQTYANQGEKQFEGFGSTLFTNWSVGGGNLKGTVSYNRTTQFDDAEGDGTPIDFTHTMYTQNVTQEFAELIYASNPERPFTFIVGANYFHEWEFQHIDVPVSFLPVAVSLGGTIRTNSYAAFTHVQYAFDFDLKLFAGVRVTTDEKHIDEFNNFIGTTSQHHSWTQPTYEVGTSYDITRSVTGYVKYATGYKGGGYSAGGLTPAFNPEKDQLVEMGLKGSYLDEALQANLAVFHMDYNDLQVAQVTGVISSVTNAARATVNGVEVETVERLTSALRFELSVGYLNAYFDKFNTVDSSRPALGTLNLAGNLLPLAPHFTANAAGYYDIPIGAPGKLTGGAQYDWKSRLYFSEFNLPIASQGAVGRLNLTLTYLSPNERWSVGAYARNVTNKTIKTSEIVVSSLLGSLALAEYQPGREVGLSFHYKF